MLSPMLKGSLVSQSLKFLRIDPGKVSCARQLSPLSKASSPLQQQQPPVLVEEAGVVPAELPPYNGIDSIGVC